MQKEAFSGCMVGTITIKLIKKSKNLRYQEETRKRNMRYGDINHHKQKNSSTIKLKGQLEKDKKVEEFQNNMYKSKKYE